MVREGRGGGSSRENDASDEESHEAREEEGDP